MSLGCGGRRCLLPPTCLLAFLFLWFIYLHTAGQPDTEAVLQSEGGPTPRITKPGPAKDMPRTDGQQHHHHHQYIDPHITMTNFKVVRSIDNTKFYIHRAFMDDRYNETYVRIFGVEQKDLDTGSWECRWRFKSSGTPDHVVPARKYYIFPKWPRSTIFYAFNFDCHFKVKLDIPGVIAEIEFASDKGHTFRLPVEETIRQYPKRDLAVCVKPVSGKLDAIRFVEWIEIQRNAGIKHFIIYVGDLDGQARSVLEYYQQLDLVTVVSFPYQLAVLRQVEPPTITSKQRYGVWQHIHLVALQDCLYRFQGAYRFLQFLDLDEILLPAQAEQQHHWPRVVEHLAEHHPTAAGFLFSTAWHVEELGQVNATPTIPRYLYTQRYARASMPSHVQPKSVIVTSRAVSVNYHSVMDVTHKRYANVEMSWEKYGYVHHYRGTCTSKLLPKDCEKLLRKTRVDPVVTRYQSDLDSSVRAIIQHLQLTEK